MPHTGRSVPKDSLAWRLRSARLSLGAQRGASVSQEEFAALVSARLGAPFHQTRLSRIEKGHADPGLAEAIACADVAGVSVTWLAYGFDVAVSVDGVPTMDAQRAWLEAHAPATVPAPESAPEPARPPSPRPSSADRARTTHRATTHSQPASVPSPVRPSPPRK